MPNVLTSLAADMYVAADVTSRELTGFIPSVSLNAGSQRAALGDVVRAAFAPTVTSAAVVPSMTIPEGTNQTIANKTMTISDREAVQIPWEGEEQMHVNNGAGYETIYGLQIEQAMRTICNKIELAVSTAAYLGASRAYGTAGTTPFATQGDMTDAAEVLRILKDNGHPTGNNLVMSTAAGARFIGLQSRYNVAGQDGVDAIQRQGILLPTAGMDLRESAQVLAPAIGTAAGYTTNAAAYAIGATSITLITGSGTVLAGGIVNFAGDANKYVVATGVAAPGVIVLAEPGLRVAIPAAATALSTVAASSRNIAFNRSAIELVVRPPAMPKVGGVYLDAAIDSMTIIDPRSGLPFEVRAYVGYGKAMIDVSAVWAVKVWKSQGVAVLLG